ncbi:radical SAM protein [Tundrisphaera sp. TA3]|uniref:radical SAM protein n=1 Tax=Tundrisphaera sp. TA3 TaxID=3435775 RepID=UPI003EBA7A2B
MDHPPAASDLVEFPAIANTSADVVRRRLRSLEGRTPGTLLVHEIYRSIQGESTYAGLPCTFIRLTACHLRCTYCDTRHAFHHGEEIPVGEVVARALATGDAVVEVTGGEPLLQPEVLPLMAALADAGRAVLLETSGSIDIGPVDPRVVVILDVKTPGSGEARTNLDRNLASLKPTDEVKYVVADRADFDWSAAHIRAHRLAGRVQLLVGGVFGRVTPAELAAWVLESGLPLRLQVQLHKQIWGPDARGV